MLIIAFWLPPLLVGRFLLHRRWRVLMSLLTAALWTPLWLVLALVSLPPYHGRSPDAGAMMVVGVFCMAYFVFPISAIACWIGAWNPTLRLALNRNMPMGISLAIFVLIQALLAGCLFVR